MSICFCIINRSHRQSISFSFVVNGHESGIDLGKSWHISLNGKFNGLKRFSQNDSLTNIHVQFRSKGSFH